jgi:spore maturation protein CgeB
MNVLQRNLEALRTRDPGLADRIDAWRGSEEVSCERARSGAPTFRIEGRLEASAEAPEADGRDHAARFLAQAEEAGATRLVIFGLGVHTLACLGSFDGPILVVEPSLGLCRAVLEQVDLSVALGRIDLLVSDSPDPVIAHRTFTSSDRGVLVFHPTARRRASELFERLCRHFHPGGTPERLRIAVIPPLWGGTLPVAEACARAFRQIGHEVVEIDLKPFVSAYQEVQGIAAVSAGEHGRSLVERFVRFMGEVVLGILEEQEPDVAFALAQAPLDPPILNAIRKCGVTTALWFCEDFRVMRYWRELAAHYDTVFHIQPEGFAEPLRESGAYGVPLALGFDPSIHRPIELTSDERTRYGCEVSFIGAGYHNRVETFPSLLDLGLRIYGTQWPEGPVFREAMPEPNARQSAEQSNRIFNASRVNLNLHSSPWCDGINPVGDYVNPRTFELAGARVFQLVDERRELSRHFQPGLELETFSNIQECRRKILYYLEHDDERGEIAERGFQRAIREHTYRHRMEEAVSALRSGPSPVVPRRRRHRSVSEVLEGAREVPELAAVLSRVPPEARWSTDAISVAVARGKGPLSFEEKVLLFMREYEQEVRAYHAERVGQ